uniref:Uncharacterized protein n=1 Tax=Utricularia reniformis TaxID=192314 RepID=A0A1Y0B349_9LAMI|nr:hypothetical protein AEK19_MT1585 [Utricularia reniformis]ART31769.1 hypothetical protein AEK19_MT1585 [Utricularia reniformis]
MLLKTELASFPIPFFPAQRSCFCEIITDNIYILSLYSLSFENSLVIWYLTGLSD